MKQLSKATAHQLSQLYFAQFDEVMTEWAEHTKDRYNGGFFTNFDQNWKLGTNEKNIWAQARQTYMYAAAYCQMEPRSQWLELAEHGRDFLIAHAYAGQGRWYYELSEDGQTVKEGTVTIFTDLFVLMALSQYAVASGRREDMDLIRATFTAVEKNLFDPDFRDIAPHVWMQSIQRHSPYMIAINAVGTAIPLLGEPARELAHRCAIRVLDFFGANTSGYLLESLQEDGSVWDTPEGRLVNPGHILEGMWFCLDLQPRAKDDPELFKILNIIDHTYARAVDLNRGGLLHRFDCYEQPTGFTMATDTGELRCDDRVDWVHCEALYTMARAATVTGEQDWFTRFLTLHDFCQSHFRPPEGGDWYPLLDGNGQVLRRNKGGKHRVAFHVPRALLNIALTFQEYANQEK